MKAATQNVVVLKSHRAESAAPCMACSKRAQCPAAGLDTGAHVTQQVVHGGSSLYESGARFSGVYIVRSGFFKSYSVDSEGVMQVTGFHLPGDFVGLDGIESGAYGDTVEALDTSSVCRIPLSVFDGRHAQSEAGAEMMLAFVKLMSRTIAADRRMFFTLGKMSARRRIGVFLKELSERMAASGYSASDFTLCMSRTDIANYLCLALETVSRLVTQLNEKGVIAIERRNIRILDRDALVQDAAPERVRKAG
ncbi:MAG: helix-turn-helix domain-containing protein [Pseudomonadota bacterium]|nr:helix-turn-helix domain-containing protein [Pseudomonadota bacterium]